MADYSLNNPDTLTKYRTAATISEKVLAEVSKLCVPGAKFVEVCQKGDKILEEEIDKVYRGKKVIKGMWPLFRKLSLAKTNIRFLAPHDRFALVLHHPLHPSDVRRG